ncbi:hypothetical protein A9Q88_12780 [Gammaproteobacteria bacterium 50_400_T64]|nr:hypothetical protein A9Q88_12780 [Gammaproteobacteria bacterium 50_400_T64]
MKKLTKILAGLSLLSASSLYASGVYRVIDENGEITFTDSPPTNIKAEAVNLPTTNIATPSIPAKKEGEDGGESTDETAYTSARIIQPANKATIPPGQSDVVVQLSLKPSLQTEHLVQIYIDGKKQGSAIASTTFTLTNLNRGQHKVFAKVIGTDKKSKAKTQTVTFYVKQHSSNKQKKGPPKPSPLS